MAGCESRGASGRLRGMNKSNVFSAVLLAASVVLFSAGVARKVAHARTADGARVRTIAVIPKGTINMWWDVVRVGAEASY